MGMISELIHYTDRIQTHALSLSVLTRTRRTTNLFKIVSIGLKCGFKEEGNVCMIFLFFLLTLSVIVDLTTKDVKFEESLCCCELYIYVCNVFLYHRRHFNESTMNDLKKLKCPIQKTTTAAVVVVASASPSPSHRHRNRNEHSSREIENE